MKSLRKIILENLEILKEQPKQKIGSLKSFTPNHFREQILFNNINNCKTKYREDLLKKARNYTYSWVSNPETIKKILKSYSNYDLTYDFYVKKILPIYKQIIYSYKYYYYTTKDPNIKDFYNNRSMGNAWAICIPGESYVYVNCDNLGLDENKIMSNIVHELFHAIFYFFPLTPAKSINDLISHGFEKTSLDTLFKNIIPDESNSNKNLTIPSDNTPTEEIKNMWRDKLKRLEKVRGLKYIINPTENNSRLQELRFLEKIKPGQNIPNKTMWDYVTGKKNASAATWLLANWAYGEFPDFSTFMNGINSMAINNKKVSPNSSQSNLV
jgi:hypothetical protein